MSQAGESHTEDFGNKSQESSKTPARHHQLALLLFVLALSIYLLTRMIRLQDFPIYFFTDEAIQTQHAADFINREFKSNEGELLPTYFKNGGQYNLSLSVYAQVLPTLIFGKSIWVTRGVSVLITLAGAIFLGLLLRDAFKSRYWWLGPMLLSIIPTWFLHSRTAFETVMMASFYAGFLYFYLRYRQGKIKSLYFALVFGALAFYAYSPGQVIIVLTGLLLLISDAPFHWKNRRTALFGFGLLVLLALPYIRFILVHGHERMHHLTVLGSYWVKPITFQEKILIYFKNYAKGFNPFYWFWPNPTIIQRLWPQTKLPTWLFSSQNDLERHIMKGYGHILQVTLPFWVIGLVSCIKRFKDYSHRTLLLATLAAPAGAAIVDWGITRGMVFIIPTTIITALGFEASFNWLQSMCGKLRYAHIAGGSFLILAFISIGMLIDSLNNGPTWYDNYGLHGMQYGAQQVFTRAAEIGRDNPETTVLVSSIWANGPNVILRFFTDDLPNVRMGNINSFSEQYRELDRNMLFVMTEEDLHYLADSKKFTNVTVEETLPYPDGTTGFYFVRLEYVDNIEEVLEEERAARQALISEDVDILGQTVQVSYPVLDMNEIGHIFDGDPTTLMRTLEANPLKLILDFPDPVDISSVTAIVGGTPTRFTVTAYAGEKELETLTQEVDKALVNREMTVKFKQTHSVDRVKIEILNSNDGEIAHVHLWEVILE